MLEHVIEKLGLEGDGVGARVGLRNSNALTGLEGASFAKEVVIKEWNLPDVVINVKIEEPFQKPNFLETIVQVDDIVAFKAPSQETDKCHLSKNP